jgi:hypothetical protein
MGALVFANFVGKIIENVLKLDLMDLKAKDFNERLLRADFLTTVDLTMKLQRF